MEKEKLNNILAKHKAWLNDEEDGVRADLRGAELIVITLPFYTAYIHADTVRIGCKHFTHEEWRNFSDDEINKMDDNALEFWNGYKQLIFAGIDAVKAQIEKRAQETETQSVG